MRFSVRTAPTAAAVLLPGGHSADNYFDVIDALLGEHDDIRRLFAGVQRSAGPRKAQLFAELRLASSRHEGAERAVVHPVVRRSGADGDQVGGARVAEEEAIARSFEDLNRLGAANSRFDGEFALLYELVLQHVTREELDEFPLLREHVPAAQRTSMAVELLQAQVIQTM